MKLLKDYDITILYHLGQANVIADALSKKVESMGNLACLAVTKRLLANEMHSLANGFMQLDISQRGGLLTNVEARFTFLDQIKAKQFEDVKLSEIRDKVLHGEAEEAILDGEGILHIKERDCVPHVGNLISTILDETRSSKYFVHPSATKMHCDLRQHYWWGR